MTKVVFFEMPIALKNIRLENGPKEFMEFSEREMNFLKKNVKADSLVLDVGCGTGKHILELSKKAELVFGIDSSKQMIDKAEANLKSIENARLILNDAEKLPFADNLFDFVVCTRNTFGNFLHQKKVLKEMKRVLKPKGRMLIGVYSQNAKDLQLAYYKKNKLKIIRITKDCIYAYPDFKSERFTKQKLEKIFKAGKLHAKIIPLNKVSWECLVSKSNQRGNHK